MVKHFFLKVTQKVKRQLSKRHKMESEENGYDHYYKHTYIKS